MKKFFKLILRQWSLLLSVIGLLILNFALLFQNFTPNTWLTGWDNLHPEFNLGLNISRSLSAVWQEYQGLGLLGGMGHAADLPREILLAMASAALPMSQLRYFWVFLMLIFGSIGVFLLARFLLNKNGSKISHLINLSGFTSGVFYLLNLATVQVFYTPFETFVSFFGFLPWFLYFSLKYLKVGGRGNLLYVFFIFILGATSFYVQTLFLVFIIILGIFAIDIVIKLKKTGFRRLVFLGITILAASAYWLLPPLYFTFSKESVIEQSKINSIATVETQLMNQGAATISNLATLRGFWFDYIDIDNTGNYRYLFQDWRSYMTSPLVQAVGGSLFVIACAGLIYHFLEKENFWKISLPLGFIFCFAMLALGNSLLGNIPIIGQAFRSVFTKWSTTASLFYALGLGAFVALVARRFRLIGLGVITTLLLVGVVVFIKPVFEGQLISPTVRVEIPQRYFNLFDYFDSQPKQSRIVNLPMLGFWGWYTYDWGYRGSGFLWYGIKQPILDRTFDVWSSQDESFYHEFSTAVYAQDKARIASLIKKYDISYALFDESIVAPKGQEKLLMGDTTKQILSGLGGIVAFDKEGLIVYKFTNQDSFISAPQNYTSAEIDTSYTRQDVAFDQLGAYINSDNPIVYPFNGITAEKSELVSFNDNKLTLNYQNLNLNNYSLIIPQISESETIDVPITVSYKDNQLAVTLNNPYDIVVDGDKQVLPQLPTLYMTTNRSYKRIIVSIANSQFDLYQGQSINNHLLLSPAKDLTIDVFDASQSNTFDISSEFGATNSVNNCWTREGQEPEINTQNTNGIMSITTKDAVGCASFKLGTITANKALMQITLPYKSDNGSRPDFCLQKEGVSDCLNKEVFYHTKASDSWSEVIRNTKLDGNMTYWLVLSGRPSDDKGETWTINYQSPKVIYYSQIAGYTFKPSTWQEYFEKQIINLDKINNLNVVINSQPIPIDFAQNGRTADNCDLFDRGVVNKSVSGSMTKYLSAEFASTCDYMTLEDVNTSQSFLLRLQGEAVSGRGPKMYLFNTSSNRNDIEDLVGTGKFDTSYSVLPWLNLESKDYVLNLEVRSFGNSQTINNISNISLYPVPINWLTSWIVSPQTWSKTQNNVNISDVNHRGTYLYTANINAAYDNGLIELSQVYDTGWIAFAGLKPLHHVKVSGWANGWLVPRGEHNITIIYMPQLLEFGGFIVVILLFIYLNKPIINRFRQT